MAIEIREYQQDCINKVIHRIENGAVHISVAMTAGLGQKFTSQLLAKKLFEQNHHVMAVFKHKNSCFQFAEMLRKDGLDTINALTLQEFLTTELPADEVVLILHDLNDADRIKIKSLINRQDLVTISFFSPVQDIPADTSANQEMSKRLQAYVSLLDPVVCVYETKDLIDIRDSKYAESDETDYIRDEIISASQELSLKIEKNEEVRDTASRQAERLQVYISAIKQKGEADEQNEAEKLKKQLLELKNTVAKQEAQIKQQNEMISFMEETLSSIGIAPSALKKSFHEIKELRNNLAEELNSKDEAVREVAIKRFQDKVAESVAALTKNIITVSENESYEKQLQKDLTPEIWQKLSKKSQAFLITALSNYYSMIVLPGKDTFDYSGVCLLVTKALEVETSKRFFEKYKEYLQTKYASVSQWPFVLRKINHGEITDEIIEDGEFTLGSVVPTIGVKREYDEVGNIRGYTSGSIRTQREFFDYAKSRLFKSQNRQVIEEELRKDYLFIEKVRLDYRNPSAHRDELTMTTAKECMEYVISVEHMLRDMLQGMKI